MEARELIKMYALKLCRSSVSNEQPRRGAQLFIILVMITFAFFIGVNFGTYPQFGSSEGPLAIIVVRGPLGW